MGGEEGEEGRGRSILLRTLSQVSSDVHFVCLYIFFLGVKMFLKMFILNIYFLYTMPKFEPARKRMRNKRSRSQYPLLALLNVRINAYLFP